MTYRYVVSRVDPRSVEPDLIRIWHDNLPVLGDVRAKLRWSYHDAPERPAFVYVLAAVERDRPPRVVGSAGVAVRRFSGIAGELRVALGCDLAVDPPHRTLQPALQVVREVRRDTGTEFDLTYNFPNRHARGLYARAGYHNLGAMTRYVRVLQTAPYLARHLPRPLARVAAAPVDFATRARHVLPIQRATRRFRVEWLDEVDERFDALWRTARPTYGIIGRRDASWLRWRCIANPSGKARVAALVDRRSATLRAYAIVQQTDDVVHLRDLFGLPGHVDSLLTLLCPLLRATGASSVSVAYLGSASMVELLAKHGFSAREADRHVYVGVGNKITGVDRTRALDAESWHLTDYDEDN
jgi:hypothetical protein